MSTYGPDIVLNSPAFIHPSAAIYGKVKIEEGASVWPNAVIRCEFQEVVIGAKTNIQDFVMIHTGAETGTYIGKNCSITHHCTLHGCTVGNDCLIGINSTIMDGCVIGDNCIIGGHTFLKEGTVIPDNSVVMGTPGKVVKTRNNLVANRMNAYFYYKNAIAYSRGLYREWSSPGFMEESVREMEKIQKESDALA